jgi:ABC-type nitrate/sulfonate/bicarbonate transport system substrate-binding protein
MAGASVVTPGCQRRKPGSQVLRVQLPWVYDAEFLGYLVANNKKAATQLGKTKTFYEDEGLEVVLKAGGPDIIPEVTLLHKDADVALTSPDNTLTYVAKERAPLVIVGTQYYKSPLGVVSLGGSGINGPKDLVGKRLAVPTVNVPSVNAMLEANGIKAADVLIRPYQYDPSVLMNGTVDATLDFVTNVPFVIEKKTNKKPVSFLLADHGFPTVMDTVVIPTETLEGSTEKRELVLKWLRASRRAWEAVFDETRLAVTQGQEEGLPTIALQEHFASTKRDAEMERAFNRAQMEYIVGPAGGPSRKVFELQENDVAQTVASLNRIGIKAAPFHFDRTFAAAI